MPENQETQSQKPQYPPYYRPRKQSKWWIPVVIILAVFALIIVGGIALVGVMGTMAFEQEEFEMKDKSVLYLNLGEMVPEYKKENPFSIFGASDKISSLSEITEAIQRADDDDRIEGIYFKSAGTSIGFAKMKQLQEELEEFKKSGKFVVSYLGISAKKDYYLAMPSDEIYSGQESMVWIQGFGATSLFFKDMLANIGVDFYVQGFEDFKSAAESYDRNSWSDSAKLQLRTVYADLRDDYVDALVKYRGLDKDEADEVLNVGVFATDSLLQKGLIDEIAYEDEVREILKKRIYGGEYEDEIKSEEDRKDYKLNLVTVGQYLSTDYDYDKEIVKDKKIAIIYGSGAIMPGKSEGWNSDFEIRSDNFVKYLKKAREDDKVKIVILRIDSPGGSVLASDEIRQAIRETQKVKPVYSSMSDVAASGGYYISMDCDTIIASPNTITGSIGVISMIPNFSETLNKLDIGVDTIAIDQSAMFLNPHYEFTESDKQRFYQWSKNTYFRFVEHVAEGRGMEFDEVRALAKGRVWTGEDAKEIGLVDVLGDFEDAIKLAKKRIGVDENKLVYVDQYPKKREPIEIFLEMFGLDASAKYQSAFATALAAKLGVEPSVAMQVFRSLPIEDQKQLKYSLDLMQLSRDEKVLIAAPYCGF